MKIHKEKINFQTKSQIEFVNVTDQVQEILERSGIREGQVLVFSEHTTMSVVINHYEPMLLQDFMRTLYRTVPVDGQYSHDMFELRRNSDSDGRSNGHSHCKALLIDNSKTVPVERGKLVLGSKQSIIALEFDGARKRDLFIQVIGL
jgi:secondary thiamine-phosphate synthase enzyme